jgi:thiol-disulfide isomerase/thioredoxin
MTGSRCCRLVMVLGMLLSIMPPAACAAAPKPDAPNGQVFPEPLTWFNSKPLTEKDLEGKVVIVDFWCYTCINCIRTLPYMKEWHNRYAKHGLVIVGVHAPEFEFEKTGANVKDSVAKFGLPYPIVMDNDRRIWDCFSNQFWPAKYIFSDGSYLLDHKGGDLGGANRRAKFEHFGEGEYEETEKQFQELLRSKGVKAEFPPPMKSVNELDGIENKGAVCYPVTRELYANFRGVQQGQWGTDVELDRSKIYRSFEDVGRHAEGRAYLKGTWQVTKEYARHPLATKDYEDYIVIRYKAVEVNAVFHLHNGKGPVLVKATLDGKPLPKDKAGADIVYENGESFLKVTEPRMYNLVKTKVYGTHDLALWPKDDGFAVYAYTFGSCVKPDSERFIGPVP